MKISTRLIWMLTLVVGVVMTVGGYFILHQREIVLEQSMRNEVEAHARTLQIALEAMYRAGREHEAQELIDSMSDNPRVSAVVLFSALGDVIKVSDQLVADEIKFPPEVRHVLETGDLAESIRIINNEEVFSILMPIRVGNKRQGVFEIALPMSFIEADYARARREIALVTLLLFVIIIFVVVLVTRYSILRPIDELLRGAAALGRGNLDYRVIVPSNDHEFAQLENEFNRMANNLEEQRNNALREMEKRLKLERELRQSEHLASVGRLAAGVAHEIGTPLNVIEVRAEQVLNDQDGSLERRRRNITIIITQVERIAFIVRQLLNLARPYKLQRVPIDLNALIASTVDMLETKLKTSNGSNVIVEIEPHESTWVNGDKELLRQVFSNLIVNAVHAMPNGGKLWISYAQNKIEKDGKRFLVVQVSDNGTGIKPEHFSPLFDPFFTTKDVGSGIGLGLPVSRRIIEEHGGWIEAANNEHGGATFTIHLPVAPKIAGESAFSTLVSEKEKAIQ